MPSLSNRLKPAAAGLLLLLCPALATAQTPTTSNPAVTATPAPASQDAEFITGIRRIGVMVGQVVECTAEGDRGAVLEDAMALADQIALNFGLKAAYNFTGSVGYGSGKPFDKADCAKAQSNWTDLRKKYLNR